MKLPRNKILRIILFPKLAFLLVFIPIAFAFLVYSMLFIGSDAIITYISYAAAFYALVILTPRCIAVPGAIKKLKQDNKYISRLYSDTALRMKISLYGSLAFNTAYAILQLGLGYFHGSIWYYSMSAYHILLALMRFFLLGHARAYRPTEDIGREYKKYGLCGLVLLLMSSILTAVVFLMILNGEMFAHNEITTIALAAYTFTSFTLSAVNAVKYRKYKSPVFSAAKTVSLSAACVSMLTLEASMLSTFSSSDDPSFSKLMLSISGAAIFIYIAAMAIYMMTRARKMLKAYGSEIKTQEI